MTPPSTVSNAPRTPAPTLERLGARRTFEYIQEDGTLGVALDGGVKIFGAYSRKMDQKSLSIFARARYGTETIDYPLFETRPYTQC